MLSLTRKSDYALVALAYLGQRHDEASRPAVSARTIAEQFSLPLPLLMNVLKALAQAGLVVSTRGPLGGYMLAVEPSRVSVLDVVQAIEGPVRMTMCSDAQDGQGDLPPLGCCPAAGVCPVEGPIRRLNQRLQRFLAQMTLADLLESQVDVPLERVGV